MIAVRGGWGWANLNYLTCLLAHSLMYVDMLVDVVLYEQAMWVADTCIIG